MDADSKYEADIAPYRQGMLTSIGIVLGFILAFLANWAAQADAEPALSSASDYVIALALLGSAVLFTTAIFRLLDNRIVPDAPARYRFTFRIYVAGFVLAFAGLAVALVI